tara:strand:+ start:2069 stop:2392 length:324 start_codon:yes stop_codon:yes gene_type:complete
MIKTIKHFIDPGHGWYKVSRKLLRKMNLLSKISSFSYQKNDWVYLEEDCDATIFFDRYKELFGEIQIRVTSNIAENMSSIRYYDSFGRYSDEYNIPPCGGDGIPKPI